MMPSVVFWGWNRYCVDHVYVSTQFDVGQVAPAGSQGAVPMRSTYRVLATLAAIAVGLAFAVGGAPSATSAQGSCGPNYGATDGGCIPEDRDYDCPELWEMGIGDIPVIGNDWMRLDGYQDFETGEWISAPDGLGCEWVDAGDLRNQQPVSMEPEPTLPLPTVPPPALPRATEVVSDSEADS